MRDEFTLSQELCSGCGICVAVCPQDNLQMISRDNGDRTFGLVDSCSPICGRCASVCPFSEGVHAPRGLNTHIFSDLDALFNEAVGLYKACYVGYSLSPEQRQTSASGGLASWFLGELFGRNLVDKAAVVVRTPGDGRLFSFRAVEDAGSLRQASGSVYYPVSIEAVLEEVAREPEVRWAVVGIPCLVAGVRRATLRFGKDYVGIKYLLGLACGMLQNDFYTESLILKSGVKVDNVGDIRYRIKDSQTFANNYRFQVWNVDGDPGTSIPYHPFPYYLGRRGFFRYNSCNFCKDVFAEAADICFMDAWLPRYSEDPRGTSIVVLRNQEVEQVFLEGDKSGSIHITEIPVEDVVASQAGQVYRKQVLIDLRLGQGRSDFGAVKRLDWQLQKYTQRRSKAVWSKLRHSFGTKGFGIVLMDVRIAWWFLDHILPLFSRGKRFLKRMLGKISSFVE